MDAESNEITVSYINILELTTLFFIVFIIIISHYSITSTIFSPILIFVILFVTRYLKYKRHCVGEVPVNNLISRCCVLLCIYLYSHYTVKCVPLLNLIFSKLFEFPLTGKIFRGIFAYLFTYLGNEIIYKYNKKDDEIDEFNINKICKIGSTKINVTLIILGGIILNTYLQNYKDYISTKLLIK